MTAAKPTPVDHTLPDGWQRVRLGGICSPPQYGASAPARDYDPKLPRYVRITDITDHGRLRVDDPKSADPDKVKGYELEPGDLLFARSGSVGRTYLHRPEDGKCVYAGYLIRFRALPNIAAPEYLEHWTHSSVYFNWISSIARRGAQTNVNATEYSSLPILLPPLPEQRAIAAVLDSIDDSIEGAEAVIAATEDLRDALLHDLLTRGLPGQHNEFRDVPGLGTIPADWEVVRLGDVVPKFEYGTSVRCSSEPVGMPILRIPNIASGDLNLTDLKYADLGTKEAANVQLDAGDILLVRTNGNPEICGRCWVTDCLEGHWGFASYLVRGRTDRSVINPWFIGHFLRSEVGRRLLKGNIRTSAGNYNLSVRNLGGMPLPFPTLNEQEAIVKTVKSLTQSLEVARKELAGLRLLQESTADALLTGRVRV